MKDVRTPLAKSVLAAAPAVDAAIQKKVLRPAATSLIISNKEMNDIMKIVKSLGPEESGSKRISWSKDWGNSRVIYWSKTTGRWISQNVISYISFKILGSMLVGQPKISGRGVIIAGEGVIWAGEGTIREGQDF